MKVTDFGATVKGDETKLYTLTNKNGMEIAVSDYGATLVQVIVPDKEGKPCDVVLGYDEAAGYEEGDLFFGAIVGRSANRIGGASFETERSDPISLKRMIMAIISTAEWIFITRECGR